ncbi:PREDICTED: putative clathrin assembly protein At1g33340 [Tarenaya hassleriana]|uniref:putative clathrin assembly protein At1g33340 n=1 Tax=Tarenaya hassleriana TaxID=28532 RepID=UPI00053C79B8|nr:PREDICTED: putative clathrin assembly protein At1g33340 [Tarenaya hassleriana]
MARFVGLFRDFSSLFLQSSGNNSVSCDIEATLIRATRHHQSRMDDVSMERLLIHVCLQPESSVPSLVDCISRRLEKTKNRRVALKALLLIHRILRFDRRMHMARAVDSLQLDRFWFMKNEDPSSVFLRNYAALLKERAGWTLNQSDHRLEPVVNRSESGVEPAAFHVLTKCQWFVEKVLACAPVNVKPIDNLVLAALRTVLEESFKIYETYTDELKNLFTVFFDLSEPERTRACGILRAASQQYRDLRGFYEKCRESAVDASLEYPSVEVIDVGCITSLEEFTSATSVRTSNSFHTKFSSRIFR